VIFTPDAGQIGQIYQVNFESRDDNGFRGNTLIVWEVVPRQSQISAFVSGEPTVSPLGDEQTRPGTVAEFSFRVANSGNTVLQNVVLYPLGAEGPVTIPYYAMSMNPGFFALLSPGESAEINLQVQTAPDQPTGAYLGRVHVGAQSAVEPVSLQPTFGLLVNQPPHIAAPSETIHVDVNQPLSIPIQAGDPDAQSVLLSMDYAAFGATLTQGQSLAAIDTWSFEWTPPADAAGTRVFPLVATDGNDQTVHELVVQVAPVVGVPEPSLRLSFQARPNPAAARVELSLVVPHEDEVEVSVFDINGRLVSRPYPRARVDAGPLVWNWEPKSMPSGVYFVRARVGKVEIDRRIVWLGN
jgi:hypothetical protein